MRHSTDPSGRPGTPEAPAKCKGCQASWRGTVRAQCRVCHVTFDDDVLFDAHRRTGVCVHPRSLGLVVMGGVWCRLLAGEWAEAS